MVLALHWCRKYVWSRCYVTQVCLGCVCHFSPYAPEVALGEEQEKGLRVKGNLKSLGNYSIIFYVVDSALILQCGMKKVFQVHSKITDAASPSTGFERDLLSLEGSSEVPPSHCFVGNCCLQDLFRPWSCGVSCLQQLADFYQDVNSSAVPVGEKN